jgi:Leucine-rich repeat (LRR) protein
MFRILLSLLALWVSAPAFAQVSALEREMLLDFYESTNGSRWLQSGGWNGAAGTECTWYGVTCFNGAVTELRLPDNNLGEADASHPFAFLLPVEPVNLPELTHLDLAGNRFEQIVPNAYGSFPKLVSLDLGRMDLSTALPAQLGNVTTLQTLFLDRNRFTGPLPESWSQLVQLRNLDLYDNALSGTLPSSWSAMTQLRFLSLGDDPFTLDADATLDGPLPPSWGQLTQLQTLSLSLNRIDGPLPASFANLLALRRLELASNELQGGLPAWIGNLVNLETLVLSDNQFDGALPASLGALTKLQTLNLFDNAFTGPLPSGIAKLSALQGLRLQNNQLEGPFPEALCGLANLQQLLLTSNRFDGPLPACIGQLVGLRKLGLGANAFRGSVPASLMQLTSLEALPDNVIDDGHLFYNALWSDDPAVLAFIDTRFPRGNLVPDFSLTQTRAPFPVMVQADVPGSVRLQWTPRGQVGGGRFQVLGAASPTLFCDGFDAPCIEEALLAPTVDIETANRGVTEQVVGGLQPGLRYRFMVLSISEPNPSATPFFFQPNRVISDPSGVVGITLP